MWYSPRPKRRTKATVLVILSAPARPPEHSPWPIRRSQRPLSATECSRPRIPSNLAERPNLRKQQPRKKQKVPAPPPPAAVYTRGASDCTMEGVLECQEDAAWDERSPSQATPAPFEAVESDAEEDGNDSGDEIDDNDESFDYSLAKEAEFLPLADYSSVFQPEGTVPRAAVVAWMLRVRTGARRGTPDAPGNVVIGSLDASRRANQAIPTSASFRPRRAALTVLVSAPRFSP